MAKFSNVNNVLAFNTNAGAAAWLLAFKTVAVAAGWTVPRSSDGTTYNATGDQITTANTGAGGMQNTGAWFILREPGGRREWCWQYANGATQLNVRVKYSPLARFTGGTPGAVRVPSATDEQLMFGGGTDASPTYAGISNAPSGRYHIVFNSTPIGGCYPFVCFWTATGAATQSPGFVMQEPMAPGSYSVTDGDPCLVYCSNGNFSTSASGYFAYGTAGQVWVPAITYNPGIFTGAMGVDLGDGSDLNGYGICSAIVSGSTRVKGITATIASKGPARTYPATTNTGTDAKAYLGTLVLPYPENTVPSVA